MESELITLTFSSCFFLKKTLTSGQRLENEYEFLQAITLKQFIYIYIYIYIYIS